MGSIGSRDCIFLQLEFTTQIDVKACNVVVVVVVVVVVTILLQVIKNRIGTPGKQVNIFIVLGRLTKDYKASEETIFRSVR